MSSWNIKSLVTSKEYYYRKIQFSHPQILYTTDNIIIKIVVKTIIINKNMAVILNWNNSIVN